MKETIKAKPGQFSIIEMVSRFPKNGLGVKIFKKTWPENSYWKIMHANLKGEKGGKLFGVQYWQGSL